MKTPRFLLLPLLSIGLLSCQSSTPVSLIAFSRASISLHVGESAELRLIIQGGSKEAILFSSDESIASISKEGIVKANGVGSATIFASCEDQIARCYVEVTEEIAPVTYLSQGTFSLEASLPRFKIDGHLGGDISFLYRQGEEGLEDPFHAGISFTKIDHYPILNGIINLPNLDLDGYVFSEGEKDFIKALERTINEKSAGSYQLDAYEAEGTAGLYWSYMDRPLGKKEDSDIGQALHNLPLFAQVFPTLISKPEVLLNYLYNSLDDAPLSPRAEFLVTLLRQGEISLVKKDDTLTFSWSMGTDKERTLTTQFLSQLTRNQVLLFGKEPTIGEQSFDLSFIKNADGHYAVSASSSSIMWMSGEENILRYKFALPDGFAEVQEDVLEAIETRIAKFSD